MTENDIRTDIIQIRIFLRNFNVEEEEEKLSDSQVLEVLADYKKQLEHRLNLINGMLFNTNDFPITPEKDISVLFNSKKSATNSLTNKLKKFSKGDKISIT